MTRRPHSGAGADSLGRTGGTAAAGLGWLHDIPRQGAPWPSHASPGPCAHAAAPAQWPAVGKATATASGYSDMGPGPTAPRCLPRLALCSWLREQLATAERGGSGRLPAGGVPSSVRRRRRPLGASSLPPTARASRPCRAPAPSAAGLPCASVRGTKKACG